MFLEKTIKVLQEVISTSAITTAKSPSAISNSISKPGYRSRFALTLKFTSCTQPRLLSPFQAALKDTLTEANFACLSNRCLPTQLQKWTVLASPFVHKTARTQLERRRAGREMRVEGIETEECRERLIWWIKRIVPADVELSITVHERM